MEIDHRKEPGYERGYSEGYRAGAWDTMEKLKDIISGALALAPVVIEATKGSIYKWR